MSDIKTKLTLNAENIKEARIAVGLMSARLDDMEFNLTALSKRTVDQEVILDCHGDWHIREVL